MSQYVKGARQPKTSSYRMSSASPYAAGTISTSFLSLPSQMLFRALRARVSITGKSDGATFTIIGAADSTNSVEGGNDIDVLSAALFSGVQLFANGTDQLIQQMPLPGYRTAIMGTLGFDPMELVDSTGIINGATLAVPAVGAAATTFDLVAYFPIGLHRGLLRLDEFKQSSAALTGGRLELTGVGGLPITVALSKGNLVISAVNIELDFEAEVAPSGLAGYMGPTYFLQRFINQQADNAPIAQNTYLGICATGQVTGPVIVDDSGGLPGTSNMATNSVATRQLIIEQYDRIVDIGREPEAARCAARVTPLVPFDLDACPDEVSAYPCSYVVKTSNASAITLSLLSWRRAPAVANTDAVDGRDAQAMATAVAGKVVAQPGPNRKALG